jgi:hypothetical protein
MANAKMTKTTQRLYNFFIRAGRGEIAGSLEQDARNGQPLAYWKWLRSASMADWRERGIGHPLAGRSPRGNRYPLGY